MKTKCLKSRRDTERKNHRVSKRDRGRILLLSTCAVCVTKWVIKQLGIKTPLIKLHYLKYPILKMKTFCVSDKKDNINTRHA